VFLMKAHRLFRTGSALALFSAFAGAQEQSNSPYSVNFKTRAGLIAGDFRDAHYDNKIMGLGVEGRMDLKHLISFGGAISAELIWEYAPGRHHDTIDWSNPGLNLHPYWSVSDRKETAQGWNIRLAYWGEMPAFFPSQTLNDIISNMEWFVGVGIDRYKVRSDFRWTLRDQTGLPNNTINDIWNNRPPYYSGGYGSNHFEDTAISPSVFAGIKYRISNDFGFEVAFRNFGMRTHTWTPGAFLGREEGVMESGTTRGTSIEFAFTARL
jgi:hypothetical protein